MKKYSILFAIAYFIITYGVGEVAERLQINAGITLNLVSTVVAVLIAAWWFGREHSEPPTSDEINAFAFQALAGVWIASLILTVIVLFFLASGADVIAMLSSMSTTVLIIGGVIGVIVMSLVYFFIIKLSFTWFTKLLKKPA